MDEFNNVNQTPQQNGDGYIPPQQNNGAAPYAPQDAEPRTPYQTPVQHPAYQAPQQEQQPRHGKAVVIGLCGVGAACLLFAGGALLGTFAFSGGADPAADGSAAGPLPTVQIADTPKLDPDNYDVVNGLAGEEIYKKVSPSIVSVIAETPNGTGTGSGVIMTADGYVITNNHVVEGAAQVTVQLRGRPAGRRGHRYG